MCFWKCHYVCHTMYSRFDILIPDSVKNLAAVLDNTLSITLYPMLLISSAIATSENSYS